MTRFYQEKDGRFRMVESLWKALALEDIPHSVISLVGAGGKTSTMYQLARECRDRGKRVIVTTSTHIACPDEYPVVVIQRASQLERMFEDGCFPEILVVAGEKDAEKNKLAGMSVSEISRLTEYCDVLLIEADGSRRMPLKICAEHEPVICDATQVVLGCVGLSAVGQLWKDVCFRWELVDEARLLENDGGTRDSKDEMEIDDVSQDGEGKPEIVQPWHVARILRDRNVGTRKRAEHREYRIVLNQMDEEDKLRKAEAIVKYLKEDEEGGALVIAASCYR